MYIQQSPHGRLIQISLFVYLEEEEEEEEMLY